MLKVYSYYNSICTQKVFITLAEKGIDYGTQNVDLFRNQQFSPEYLKINPKGVVPALDHVMDEVGGLREEEHLAAPRSNVGGQPGPLS